MCVVSLFAGWAVICVYARVRIQRKSNEGKDATDDKAQDKAPSCWTQWSQTEKKRKIQEKIRRKQAPLKKQAVEIT